MIAHPTRNAPLFALVGVLLLAVTVPACGGDDTGGPAETTSVPTTNADAAGGGEPADGGGDGTPGGFGTATVTVSAGTYELQIEEACLISDIGISVIASSDEASLLIAGPQEVAVVTLELPSGEMWSAAAANVVIEATTMSYAGPAMGPPGADSTISVEVLCEDVITGPGG